MGYRHPRRAQSGVCRLRSRSIIAIPLAQHSQGALLSCCHPRSPNINRLPGRQVEIVGRRPALLDEKACPNGIRGELAKLVAEDRIRRNQPFLRIDVWVKTGGLQSPRVTPVATPFDCRWAPAELDCSPLRPSVTRPQQLQRRPLVRAEPYRRFRTRQYLRSLEGRRATIPSMIKLTKFAMLRVPLKSDILMDQAVSRVPASEQRRVSRYIFKEWRITSRANSLP